MKESEPSESDVKQSVVAQKFQEFITIVATHVGEVPAGAVVLIHFKNSVTFSAVVDPGLVVQAKLNVLDSIARKFSQVISSFKADLNRRREPAVRG